MTMEIKSNNSFAEFPSAVNVGDHLKDAATTMETTGAEGTTFITSIIATDWVVTGKETVTTPAGTWDCIKITYIVTSSTTFKGAEAYTLKKAMGQLDKIRAKLGGLEQNWVLRHLLSLHPPFGLCLILVWLKQNRKTGMQSLPH